MSYNVSQFHTTYHSSQGFVHKMHSPLKHENECLFSVRSDFGDYTQSKCGDQQKEFSLKFYQDCLTCFYKQKHGLKICTLGI